MEVPDTPGDADGDRVQGGNADVAAGAQEKRAQQVVEAEAEEPDEVRVGAAVAGAGGGGHVRDELRLGPPVDAPVQHLHGHLEPVGELALVHRAGAAGAEPGGVVPSVAGELSPAEPYGLVVRGDLPEKIFHGGGARALHLAVWHDDVLCGGRTAAIPESSFEVHAHQQSNKIYEEDHDECDDDACLCKK